MNYVKKIGLSLLVLVLTGCATNNSIYHWGNYESIILNSYVEAGSEDALTQISKLTADIQRAESVGKKVPPGVYAHLAVMYAKRGMDLEAKNSLLMEKALYPESTKFIDGLLARAENNRDKS
jgi:hypothetical protein